MCGGEIIMKTSISKNVYYSLYLEELDLQAFHKLLSSKYKHPSITVRCSDGSIWETEDIHELISFENPNYRKIVRMTFIARNELTELCSLDIHPPDIFGCTAEVSIKSDKDERALFFFNELLKMLKESKPSYDTLTRVPITFIVFGLWGLITLTMTFLKMAGYLATKQSSHPFNLEMFNEIFMIVIIVLAVTSTIDWGLRKLFPKVFFALGRQTRAMERIKKLRGIIFIGISLALLVGLLVNYISKTLLD